uniref:Uncharacterized protein n=1 Tax=Salinispora arenicola (strain CNS-205) TaxID=391037 RepID=A8LWT1_SALAI
MFDFGIAGYRPRWLQGFEAVATPHSRRLAGLAGRTLRHVRLVWDLGTDEWVRRLPCSA